MKHKIFLLAILIFFSSFLYAQETRTLTLKEAIEMALKNSRQLKNNESKIREALDAVKEAEEKKLPDASVSGSYMYLPVKPTIDMKSGSGNGGPSVSQVVYGSTNVSLPLYNGGKIRYGIESARLLAEAVKLDADNDRSQLVLNIINSCINLYKAHSAIALVKENLLQSQQRVKDFTNLEKNGLLARNDLLKAQLQQSNVELSLLDAESNYKLACVNMNILMGLPEQTVLVPDKNGLALPPAVKTLDEYEQEALKGRKDIGALDYRQKAAMVSLKNTRADRYPSINLTGGYIAADIPKFLSVYNAINIGVGIRYNIASLWKGKAKENAAKEKIQQLENNHELLSDNIRLQVNQAYQAYLVSVKKIEVYEKSEIQATENYRIVKNKYDNALANTTELLEADVALLQAKLGVTNVKADSFLAYNKLLQITGQLNY